MGKALSRLEQLNVKGGSSLGGVNAGLDTTCFFKLTKLGSLSIPYFEEVGGATTGAIDTKAREECARAVSDHPGFACHFDCIYDGYGQ